MTTIYLIRHAEAEGNLYRIAQGQDDSILTDRGWRQVKALERRFAAIRINAVYSSDLYRTCATASALYIPKNLPLHRCRALREICVGAWEQKTWGEIARRWPEQMDYFSHQMHRWHMEGAETPAAVLERVLQAVRKIGAENDGKTVAVFSHGYAIRLLLARLQGCTLEETGATPHGDNTAVSLLQMEGERLRVLFRDDNSHLQTPEFLAQETARKRPNALEPGLYFEPLRLPEQGELFARLAASARADAGVPAPFDRARALADAADRPTLGGYLRGEPVGLVQFGRADGRPGRITLACIRQDCRSRGFGVQLIGQAAYHWRPLGAGRLWVALPASCGAERFFQDYGFLPAGQDKRGRTLLEKDIRFDPAFKA